MLSLRKSHILQMDTVYNDISMDRLSRLSNSSNMGSLFAVYQRHEDCCRYVDGLAVLDSIGGKSLFEQEAHITLLIAEVDLQC